jgi:hypothetical protein
MSGYSDTRYDYENSPVLSSSSDYYNFDFTPPSVDGDFYASVYIYDDMIVPESCYNSS